MTTKELLRYLQWLDDDDKPIWIKTYEQDGTRLIYEFSELDISVYEDAVVIDCR